MSAEQRFMMDVHGYIRVPDVVPPSELGSLERAFQRLRGEEPNDGGFGVRRGDPLADPELEALATHPAILSPCMEMMLGRPRLVQSSLWHDLPGSGSGMAGPLHSQRERDRRYVSFGTRPPGRISCDNLVVFVYLDPVNEGDGGLCILPGSHKSEFCRPRTLFDSYGRPTGAGHQAPVPARLPEGLVHCTVNAGDALIGVQLNTPCAASHTELPLLSNSFSVTVCPVSEATTHGVIPWTHPERSRRYIRFRFKSGICYEEHCRAQREPRQSVALGKQWGPPWTPEMISRLAPSTRAIIGGAFDLHGADDSGRLHTAAL